MQPALPPAAVATAPRGCTNHRLRTLLRRVSRLYDAEIAQAGIKGTQFSLLCNVAAFEPVMPSELARRMGLDLSTLTRNLGVLAASGLVAQGPGNDARSRSITLTSAGRDKQQEAKRHWKRAQLKLNDTLGAARVAALHALIDDSLARLDGAGDPGDDDA